MPAAERMSLPSPQDLGKGNRTVIVKVALECSEMARNERQF